MKKLIYFLILITCLTKPLSVMAASTTEYKVSIDAEDIYEELMNGAKQYLLSSTNENYVNSVEKEFCNKFFPITDYAYTSFYEKEEKGKTIYCCMFKGGWSFYRARIQEEKYIKKILSEKAGFDAYKNDILKSIGDYDTETEWYETMEDYLIDNTDYDYSVDYENIENLDIDIKTDYVDRYFYNYETVYTAYTFYKNNNKGVCADFSALVCDLCSNRGIKCYCLSSEDHAWNRVVLDGKIYDVDETWNVCLKSKEYGLECNEDEFRSHHDLKEIEEGFAD